MNALIEIHYLPSLEYFSALLQCTHVVIEKHEHYLKQSYRNRCYINSGNGILKLIVPVTAKHNKALISEVQIDYSTQWQNIHWRAFESGYRKAAFFEHYSGKLHEILFHSFSSLFDLNFRLLSFCLQSLKVDFTLSESNSYEKDPQNGYTDLRSFISPKIPYIGRGFYKPVPYLQVFGNKFAGNLSIIDLLFCEGPNAIQILRSSSRGYLNK